MVSGTNKEEIVDREAKLWNKQRRNSIQFIHPNTHVIITIMPWYIQCIFEGTH